MADRAGAPGTADPTEARTPPFASSWRREHLTVDERMARGRAARVRAPRSSHAQWAPAPDRPDPVALLEEQAESRVPHLVPIRYGRMLVSPFTFHRGAALIMAADLAGSPVSGVTVQLCGDAHLSNFGLFGTPERQMIFDVNDFDETLPGPWEWDVKRLAASLEVMGRDRGFSPADRRAVVMAGVAEYRDRIRQAAGMATLGAWYDQLDAGVLLNLVQQQVRVKRVSRKEAQAAEWDVRKAQTRDHTRVFAKRVDQVEGELRIVADPPVIVPIEDIILPGSEWERPDELIKKQLSSYRRTLGRHHHPIEEFRYVHAAYKMVGVGSVGTRCYIMLLLGRDHDDPLFLQIKEAQASVLERFLGRSTYANHGERVVAGQRLMQAATDIFLGWIRIKGLDGVTRDYYVRQFQDWKGGVDVDNLLVTGATLYGRICAATLARAHARWGDRIAITSYLGKGCLRQCDRGLRRDVRRPERAGLPGLRGSGGLGAAHRPDRGVAENNRRRGPCGPVRKGQRHARIGPAERADDAHRGRAGCTALLRAPRLGPPAAPHRFADGQHRLHPARHRDELRL